MPGIRDFRNFRFDGKRVNQCGKYIGRIAYWKLYVIENLLRLVIHSVLSVQISPNWWNQVVDPPVRRKARNARAYYSRRPLYTPPGRHDIYYVSLSDLNNILRANSNLFGALIPETNRLVGRLEKVRVRRNAVGHMNFINGSDRRVINRMYSDFTSLVIRLQKASLAIVIP